MVREIHTNSESQITEHLEKGRAEHSPPWQNTAVGHGCRQATSQDASFPNPMECALGYISPQVEVIEFNVFN